LLPPRRESTNQTPSPAPLLCSYRSALHARPLAGRVPRCDPPRTSRRCETPSTVPGTSPSTPHAEPAGVRTYSRPVTPALSQHLSRPPGTALQPGAIHYARRGFCYARACTRSSSAQAAAVERAWQTALLGRNSGSDVRDSRTIESSVTCSSRTLSRGAKAVHTASPTPLTCVEQDASGRDQSTRRARRDP
jgi:hypothetical protein